MGRKVLIIGIDGGTWELLRDVIGAGCMPYLEGLVSSGGSGILESTMPAITPAAWSSFQTGLSPGKNGIFNFGWWDKKDRKPKFVSSRDLPTTIWQRASDAGRRVGVLNVPMTYPAIKVNGCMVTGLLTPSTESEFTYPPGLKAQLMREVPGYDIINMKNFKQRFTADAFEEQIRRMAGMVDLRCRAAKYLLGKEQFDLFMVHFQASDIIQHDCWGYMREGHELYDPGKRDFLFENFYKKLDDSIAQVCESFSQQTGGEHLTVVVSDHGFESHIKKFYLANWLIEEGFLKPRKVIIKPTFLKKITSKLGVGKLLRPFVSAEAMASAERSLGLKGPQFDWGDSVAFCMRGGSGEGFIYLLEEDAAKRRETAERLRERLGSFRDPENGTSVLLKLSLKEEAFDGSNLEKLPDIVVEPAEGYSFYGTYEEGHEDLEKVDFARELHVGKHHKDGIFVVSGDGVARGDMTRLKITDIVPTILYYMQLPISEWYDGRVAEEIFSEEFFRSNPIEIESAEGAQEASGGSEDVYSQSDEDEITRRLEDLGYL